MIVLGINGGFDLPYQHTELFDAGKGHDSAVALLIDGEIVHAIEEERLNRIKHTNKVPVHAINAILKEQKIELTDIDYFVIDATEGYFETLIKKAHYIDTSVVDLLSPKAYIAQLFKKVFDVEIDEQKICFVDHHMAHAASSFYLSGFEESLILTLDGIGENISGRILYGKDNEMTEIDVISEDNSLGHFYADVVKFVGYDAFDEYKVMGLAPYGDPATYRDVFSLFYKLLPNGKFKVNRDIIRVLLYEIGKPRKKGEKFDQMYKDIAAALQEALENIIMHVLEFYAVNSGCDKLCLAGGVAHNCSANGKIYYSGFFEEIFVQPASHDAGNSVGAAIYTYVNKSKEKKIKKLEHVFLSTSVEEGEVLSHILHNWASFIAFKKEDSIEQKAAELLADGKILGWVQGKSEFGPRALGNRSIIADPRPPENKSIVNKMVKKREAYRPFAPSILEEKAEDYFDVSLDGTCFDYMTFVVNVKEEYRKELGAITHVDGTARIQTVKQSINPKYWNLINEFGKISGVPIILNTSFNNNVEPIVDTAEDAIVCFLTTGLDCLVIGDYLITKKNEDYTMVLNELIPKLQHHTVVYSKNSFDSFYSNSMKYEIGFNYTSKYNRPISKEMFDLISTIDGDRKLRDLLSIQSTSNGDAKTKLLNEIDELWKLRFVNLAPSYKMQELVV